MQLIRLLLFVLHFTFKNVQETKTSWTCRHTTKLFLNRKTKIWYVTNVSLNFYLILEYNMITKTAMSLCNRFQKKFCYHDNSYLLYSSPVDIKTHPENSARRLHIGIIVPEIFFDDKTTLSWVRIDFETYYSGISKVLNF